MADQTTAADPLPESTPLFSVGRGTIIPVPPHLFRSPALFVSSTTKIGGLEYVKRRFDFQGLRVLPAEQLDHVAPSKKRTADGERKVNSSEDRSVGEKNIGVAWVDLDVVGPDGYLTTIMKPATAETSCYSYYSAGPDSPVPALQMLESARNCEDTFNFRSKVYCKNERDRLTLPFEIRCMIYAYALEDSPQPETAAEKRRRAIKFFKAIPAVCRFLYVDFTAFMNSHYFQLYFRHPLMLQAHLEKLEAARLPFTKPQLNITRLRCVVLDLDRQATIHPERSRLILPADGNQLWQIQESQGLRPQPTVDPAHLCIRSARHVPRMNDRAPADWTAALTKLLEDYEVDKLVIRIGSGHSVKWRRLPRRVREVVQQGRDHVAEWQVVRNVGGWKKQTTGS